jgi:hypothetical protein
MGSIRNHLGLLAILAITPLTSSCFLAPLLGTVLGLGLTETQENGLFMTSDETSGAQMHYRVQTSHSALETPDGSKLYGHYVNQ